MEIKQVYFMPVEDPVSLAGNIRSRALLSTDGETKNNQNQKLRQDNRIIVFAL
jgi:hypothetical protein